MHAKEPKNKEDKAGCADFCFDFNGFQGMREWVTKWRTDQDCPTECIAMMDRMKDMMEMCCGSEADDAKDDCTKA